jgi:hypothetical protein
MSKKRQIEEIVANLKDIPLELSLDHDKKKSKKIFIHWTYSKESALLDIYEKQYRRFRSEAIKSINWSKISSAMTKLFDPDIFTGEKCRNKYNTIKGEYMAYQLIINNCLTADSDDSLWADAVSKNPLVTKFRDGTKFSHYEKMHNILGQNGVYKKDPMSSSKSIESIEEESDSIESNEIIEDTSAIKPLTNNSNSFTTTFRECMEKVAIALKPKVTPSDIAMKFFEERGALKVFMSNRLHRNLIMKFMNDENNAKYFLRCPNKYKKEFVEDNILYSTSDESKLV